MRSCFCFEDRRTCILLAWMQSDRFDSFIPRRASVPFRHVEISTILSSSAIRPKSDNEAIAIVSRLLRGRGRCRAGRLGVCPLGGIVQYSRDGFVRRQKGLHRWGGGYDRSAGSRSPRKAHRHRNHLPSTGAEEGRGNSQEVHQRGRRRHPLCVESCMYASMRHVSACTFRVGFQCPFDASCSPTPIIRN